MSITAQSPLPSQADSISGPLKLFFAIAVGVIVTNLFAPQPLVGLIGPSLGMPASYDGFVAMVTLLGYAAGLFLLVPLADLVENRLLMTSMLGCAAAASGLATIAPNATMLMIVLFVLGACCSAIQIMVPIAAALAAPDRRGRVIGDVMGGLMIGILLARPLASLLANLAGWRAFYGVSAMAMLLLTTVLVVRLPRHQPPARLNYLALVGSLWHLFRAERALRQRALTASLVMAAFSVFWTSVALRLAQPPFGLDQNGIALFALAGAGGAVVTPLFGRFGDRGWTRPATIVSHLALLIAALLDFLAVSSLSLSAPYALALMVVGAILLDIAVTGDQTLGRRVISLLQPEARSRLNGLYVGLFFLGGALGSGLAGFAWTLGGWSAICITIALIGISAIIADWAE